MKRKLNSLEKILARGEAPLPRGLRTRTLQRLGLRSSAQAWFSRPLVWGSSLACAMALVWVLGPSPRPNFTPAVIESQTPEVRLPPPEVLTEANVPLDPLKDSTTALLAAVPTRVLGAVAQPVPAKSTPSSEKWLAGSGQPLTRPETNQASASLEQNSNQDSSVTAAHADTAWKTPQPVYRLTVKNNRLRPALGEKMRLELQISKPGSVLVRVIDAHGRPIRELASLRDPVGPVLLEWDGRMADGQDTPSGAYTIIVSSPDKTEKIGVLVIR